MSFLDKRPLSFLMVIFLDFPVLDSKADTFRIPLASKSNVTSIFGIPLGAGGMPHRSKVPNRDILVNLLDFMNITNLKKSR
nr:unnamed protein product [Callosobruchus chinensis]